MVKTVRKCEDLRKSWRREPREAKSSLLNFDEDAWACERALPAIFLCDLDQHGPGSLSEKIVQYIFNEVDANSIHGRSRSHLERASVLRNYLDNVFPEKKLGRGKTYSPIVWCRVAIQFWLQFGGWQSEFVSEMTAWIREKYRGNYPVVVPQNRADARRHQMPVEVFLFMAELPCPLSSGWQLIQSVIRAPLGRSQTKAPVRSKEDTVGRTLLATVKKAVKALTENEQTRRHFLMGRDAETGKVRFWGRREDLYDLISRRYKEIGVVPGQENDEVRKKYERSTVLRAISEVAKCRRSWRTRSD